MQSPVTISHWCRLPVDAEGRITFDPDRGVGYILSRCEAPPIGAAHVEVNVLWQFSRQRGMFHAREASAKSPAGTYQQYTVLGMMPQIDPRPR